MARTGLIIEEYKSSKNRHSLIGLTVHRSRNTIRNHTKYRYTGKTAIITAVKEVRYMCYVTLNFDLSLCRFNLSNLGLGVR